MEADVWLMGIVIEGYGVRLYVRDSSAWTAHAVADGYDGSGSGLAALVDSSDSIHTFWSATDNDSADYLVFDTTVLDSFTRVATACMDDSGRVQCAWARHGRLKFALVPEPTIEVESVGGVDWCDLTTDKLAEPVIAFSRSDGAIWLARGVGIAGLSDEPRGTVVHLLGPRTSIVKGVLFLPKMGTVPSGTVPHFRPSLLDACGRCVMDLRPGANDVSRLAPGVYFVRGPETEDGRPATDVQRVVVVK